MPEPTTADSVLCAYCGRELREFLESGGYAPGPAYEKVVAKPKVEELPGRRRLGHDRGGLSRMEFKL